MMMKHYIKASLVMVMAWAVAVPAVASAQEAAEETASEEFNAVHHNLDANFLDFEPMGLVELPRIFLVREADGGLAVDAFASTANAIRSGRYDVVLGEQGSPEEEAVESELNSTALGDMPENVPDVDTLIARNEHLEGHLEAATGHILLDLSITRHLVFAVLAALIVLLIFLSLAAKYRRGVGRDSAPRGRFQNLFELLVVFVRDEIAKPNLGKKYQQFLPYLLTVFFFILTCNLIGLVPFGATATSNIMVTATLATITFFITQGFATKDHWRHVFWPPGVPTFVKPILIPVEIMGLFTKPFALAIRLFANMTAGHLVILSLLGLIFSFGHMFGAGAGYTVSPVSVAFSVFIGLLELLVALIQAYIFTILSALFIGMAVTEHAHDEQDHEGELPGAIPGDHGHVTPHSLTGTDGPQAHREAIERPATVAVA